MNSRKTAFARARFDRSATLGLFFTVGLAVTACTLLVFLAVLDEVIHDPALTQWDLAVVRGLQARVSSTGLRVFYAISALASPITVAAIAVTGLVLLWRERRRALLIAWIAAFAGESLLNQLIKFTVRRDRPGYGNDYLFGPSFSFPSGHSMAAIVTYGMIAYALVHHSPFRAVPRWLVFAVAVAIATLVGLSRVYLGVHYPSDVLGGFAAGAMWLSVCVTGVGAATRWSTSRT